MILIIMEVVEENPLQIYTEAPKIPINLKNSVGRPNKNNAIKFSRQPQSLISIILSKEISNSKKCKNVKKIKRLMRNESTTEVSPGRDENGKNVCNESSIEFQRDKLYECNHLNCTYSTKFPSNLKTHKRIHTTEQLYICDECTFRSKFISSLKTHKRLHRDERPFVCQYCEYKCNSCSNLKKHVARKHLVINNDK